MWWNGRCGDGAEFLRTAQQAYSAGWVGIYQKRECKAEGVPVDVIQLLRCLLVEDPDIQLTWLEGPEIWMIYGKMIFRIQPLIPEV